MFCWHKWGKWQHPTHANYGEQRVSVQTRICEKCHKLQVKPVEMK